MGDFAIAGLTVGRGLVGLCPLPACDRALAEVVRFAPGLVVGLTGPAERAALGAADLPARMAAAGLAWTCLEVPDFGTPDSAPPAAGGGWPDLSARLHGLLDSGGRVLVHCRAGCGRSGMLVLRLMVEAGEAPGPALARLRRVRPCAVETDAQRLWASMAGG